AMIGNLNSFDSQVAAQVKQDYSQKEDAILTALLHIVPNKAIGAMQRNSANNPDTYSWETIFEEAITTANAEQAVSPQILSSLGLGSAISANTGDNEIASVGDVVAAPTRTPSGSNELVNGGNWWEYFMLFDGDIGPYIPAPLRLSHDDYLLDKQYPIITHEKLHVFSYNYHNSVYYKGLMVNTDTYPLYNLLQYPDVKFGYKRPGELFVAKRNWWVFSLTFGQKEFERTGIPPVTKDYVFSIYEVPSQLPITGTALTKVGKFEDGSAWQNVTLDGGLYADALETEGTVAVTQGSLSARESVTLSDETTVEGRTVTNNFDAIGEREERALTSSSDFYDASLAGNVGKVAFIPLNPGYDFLKRSGDGDRDQRISPTGWKDYTRGANQVAMRLDILDMQSLDDQIPTRIRFYYRDEDNNWEDTVYRRSNGSWPTDAEPGGTEFPFQTTQLDNDRYALIVYLDRLPGHLDSIEDAGDVSINNSIYISPLNSRPTVLAPSNPSVPEDCAVTLRGGKDMTAYTNGFSVVTDYRLYIGETLNSVATAPPANSGIPAGEEYYPPISLFAPEKRFGESLEINHPVQLQGQLSTLKTSTGDTFNPLEFKGMNDLRIDSDRINANLVDLRSPAELPPIHLMNWMVTIEEIH
ncbi:MAG: hypothetical protein AAF357_17365, partial [Verrucomicrobiota bacterium]